MRISLAYTHVYTCGFKNIYMGLYVDITYMYVYMYIYIYVCMYVCMYLPTPQHEQDVTQGQFLRGVQ